MSRRRLIALVLAALAVAGGIYGWKHFPRDRTARATLGEAVQGFRANGEGGATHAPKFPDGPELGVYRYATRGGESLDTALIDTSHDFGGGSTITVRPDPCGLEERWQVLEERWTEVRVCREAEGVVVRSVRDFHEFFGVPKTTQFKCGGDAEPVATELRVGMRWRTSCESDNGSVETATRVKGVEKVEVGGRSFPALHISSDVVLEGDNSGTGRRDEWRRRSDGLLLRKTVSTDTDFSIAGGGRFKEGYSVRLLSTKPRR